MYLSQLKEVSERTSDYELATRLAEQLDWLNPYDGGGPADEADEYSSLTILPVPQRSIASMES